MTITMLECEINYRVDDSGYCMLVVTPQLSNIRMNERTIPNIKLTP